MFYLRFLMGIRTYSWMKLYSWGVPEADVWVDTENQLHITVKDVRSAKYAVTDYVYNSSDAMFFGRDVLYGDGINYFGTTAR